MTTTAEQSLPAITCVSSLIASCPPLLGFDPVECLICVMHTPGVPGVTLARIDLVDDENAALCGQALAASLMRTGAQRVQVVLWLDVEDHARRSTLPGQRVVEELDASLRSTGELEIELAVATNGTSWWSLLCPSNGCCGEAGRFVDPLVAEDVRLNYLLAGYGTLPARADLGRGLERDTESVQKTVEALATLPRRAPTLVSRRRSLEALWRALAPGQSWPRTVGPACSGRHLEPGPNVASIWRGPGRRGMRIPSLPEAIRDLRNRGVRDALVLRLALDPTRCRTCWERTSHGLVELLRAAPPGEGAPAATLLALVSWMTGDGALATVAGELALDEDPDYRLAGLALSLMSSGLSPEQWRASFTGLSEEQCLAWTPAKSALGERA